MRASVLTLYGGLLGVAIGGTPARAAETAEAPPPSAVRLRTEAARSIVEGRNSEALRSSDAAIHAEPESPWGHYHRAEALAGLRRFDEAVRAFSEAETRFGAGDEWGRSVAIWGRARALRESGRCDEAKEAFNAYITLVAAKDNEAANMAHDQARTCQSAIERRPVTRATGRGGAADMPDAGAPGARTPAPLTPPPITPPGTGATPERPAPRLR